MPTGTQPRSQHEQGGECRAMQGPFSPCLPATQTRTGPPASESQASTFLCSRTWEEGKVLIFDDSFEHEVWQDAASFRLIFIVDVWHPELTPQQRRSLPAIQHVVRVWDTLERGCLSGSVGSGVGREIRAPIPLISLICSLKISKPPPRVRRREREYLPHCNSLRKDPAVYHSRTALV